MFWLGREKTSDNVIKESDMAGSQWLNAVSKWQCKIVRKNTEVFLRNKSSNGIW